MSSEVVELKVSISEICDALLSAGLESDTLLHEKINLGKIIEAKYSWHMYSTYLLL